MFDNKGHILMVALSDNLSAPGTYSRGYTYDLHGNILSVATPTDTTAVSYTGNQRSGDFTYDANGNMTADSEAGLTGMTYNVLNLLSGYNAANNRQVVLTYSASGEKLSEQEKVSGLIESEKKYFGNLVYEGLALYPNRLLIDGGYVDITTTNNSSNYTYRYYVQDHLGNNRLVTDDSGTILQTNHYDPYGQLLGDISSSTAVSQYKYASKEWDTNTASYDFGARRYTPSIPRWTAIDPLAEKYYSISPYVYCAGNPVNLVDLEGKSTYVKRNPDGTYEVIGGSLTDNDLNIYVGSYDDNGVFIPEYSIGKTTSITSFYNTDSKDKKGEWVIGAIIDLNNMQGQEFLNYIAEANLSVIGYAINALPKGILDFKATGGESFGVKYSNDIGFYRGMPVGIDKGGRVIISSARDIGNIVAGYIAGSHGIPWKAARIAFDGLQFLTNGDTKEGASSQNAQHLGWSMGYNHYKSLLSNSSNNIVRLL